MITKEKVRKHYIYTTDHELDDDNKMLKEYIDQLETKVKELEEEKNNIIDPKENKYYKEKRNNANTTD